MGTRTSVCLMLGLLAAMAPAKADPIKTSGGLVSGVVVSNGAVRAYKGIPFAKPPVGDLRWRAPQPTEPWTGTLVADKFGPSCMQPDPTPGHSIFTRIFYTPIKPKSEDCLYLNIWTAASVGEKRPVMVWIPGGGFRGGSSSVEIYDGAELAKKGVVLVSVNYRLWKFGFLALPELSTESERHASGNYGLLDQIAALQWVKENIAAFGGNPDNVTIFGQSAGSVAANFLMMSPLAKGLFHRVIGESGGAFAPAVSGSPALRGLFISWLQSLPDAEAVGSKLMTALKVSNLAELRQKSAEEILAVPSATRFESAIPILDRYVLPATADEIFAAGRQNDVPLLLGSTADEGSNFPVIRAVATFREDARNTLGPLADAFLGVYEANDDAQAARTSAAATRDLRLAWPTLQWARAQAHTGHSKIFYYYFAHHPPAPPEERFVENLGKDLGAYHGAELAYVFGNFVPPEWPWTGTDRELARTISQYWVNFATNGDPNASGLPQWPAFDPNSSSVLYIDKAITPGPIPNQKYIALWDTFAAKWKAQE
jgi:para-nitrobenzyl esterase